MNMLESGEGLVFLNISYTKCGQSEKHINNFNFGGPWSRQRLQVGCWCSSARAERAGDSSHVALMDTGEFGVTAPIDTHHHWHFWSRVASPFKATKQLTIRSQSVSFCMATTSHFNHCSWLNWPYALWRESIEVAEEVLAEGRSSFPVAQEPHEGQECRSGDH